jgi:hypothetical protein
MFSAYSNNLYDIDYIIVFWLNDILVNTTTQQDGSHKKKDFL